MWCIVGFSPSLALPLSPGTIMVRGENGENETVVAEEGETVTLTCSLQQKNTSNPVQYIWSREDGESLPGGAQVSIGECVCVFGVEQIVLS